MKVKEPVPEEFACLRPDLTLFTYLHLAANPELTDTLREKRVAAVGYETIELDDGSLPLLTPMSEIAGRLSLQVGAWCLQAENGGRGVLLGGASGVRPGKVVVIGAGAVGASACHLLPYLFLLPYPFLLTSLSSSPSFPPPPATLDSVYVVGSLDEALSIRGFRYHPADIEATVVRCHKSVIGR